MLKQVLSATMKNRNKKIILLLLIMVAVAPTLALVQVLLIGAGDNVVSNNVLIFGSMVLAYCISGLVVSWYTYKKINAQYMWSAIFGLVFFGSIWCILSISILGAAQE